MSDLIARLNNALEGRYVVERELGEGGMATVYLAQDLKHERSVALKVLKSELAAVVGADRFIAEIKTTANLQHPHVLALYDSGEADAFLFYVMPYVEGETLQDRIDRDKQLPVAEAVRIASAIAQALDHAHRHGVIHRDIKPANVLLQDGQPVVADFGIALAVGSAGGSRLTETSLSLGTPFYMSPEQATGDQPVGPASDIYALGCVLFEMLVGEPPYLGNTAQAVLGKIISGAPVEPTVARRSIPPNVDAAIRRALEKIPADRFATAQEFADALANPAFRHGEPTGAGAGSTGFWKAAARALAVTTVAFAALAAWALLRPDPPEPTTRMSVLLTRPLGGIGGSLALSPDGSVLVYEATDDDQVPRLWVRRWSELESRPLAGSEFGVLPSVSPDGREVAFVTSGPPPRRLQVSGLEGGVSRTLTDSAFCCSHWAEDGYIYFSDLDRGISRVRALGGAREPVIAGSQDQFRLFFPHAIAGSGVLFSQNAPGGPEIKAKSFEGDDITTLAQGGTRALYTTSGHLVFMSTDGAFLAAPLDRGSLGTTGPLVSILSGVAYDPATLYSPFAISGNGVLVYATGTTSNTYHPVWVERDGTTTVIDPDWAFDPGGNNRGFALSPDGSRLAVSIMGDTDEDVWVKELPDGPLSRLTAEPGQDVRPRWTADGREVTFVSDRANNADVYVVSADGTGSATLLLDTEVAIWEGFATEDGWVIGRTGGTLGSAGARDLITLGPGETGAPTPLLETPFDEKAFAPSPDGRWLAYESDETGQNEVYVRPFPDTDAGKWQVSSDGGVMPAWAHSGTELFYIDGRNRMVSAQVVTSGSEFSVEDRQSLFDIGTDLLINQQEQYALYDVTPDDRRFLMLQQSEVSDAEVIVVRNWLDDVERRLGN